MKRLTTILLAVAIILTLTACGGGNNNDSDDRDRNRNRGDTTVEGDTATTPTTADSGGTTAPKQPANCADCGNNPCGCPEPTVYTNVFASNESELRAAVADAGTTPTAIHLTADIELMSNFVISQHGADIKLTSDGTVYRLIATRNMDVIMIQFGATLTLEHISIAREEGTSGSGVVFDGGTLIMNSGEISRHAIGVDITRGHIVGSGTFIMNGGRITENRGKGVLVQRFTMNGGYITNNLVGGVGSPNFTMNGGEIRDNAGSGVDVELSGILTIGGAAASFTMNGGTIRNNTTSGNGGGVRMWSAVTFAMNGGEIINNTAGGDGGGVYFRRSSNDQHRDVSFSMSGGEIRNNTANIGGGMYIRGGVMQNMTFTMDGGKISENTADFGGGLHVGRMAILVMNDGEVINNTANRSGGGVSVAAYSDTASSFTQNGGVISGNTAETNGGGVILGSQGNRGATFTMTGGEIHGNTASSGGGFHVNRGTFTLDGGWIFDNSSEDTFIGQNATVNINVFDANIGGIGVSPPR
jgi:hypothetical protein